MKFMGGRSSIARQYIVRDCALASRRQAGCGRRTDRALTADQPLPEAGPPLPTPILFLKLFFLLQFAKQLNLVGETRARIIMAAQ